MTSRLDRSVDRVLSIQRPVVLAHLRGIRRLHPNATPEQLLVILERRYAAAVTTGGAAVGASAMLPFVGTGISLALSGVETAGFLETTALFAQSVTEVHGIAVTDPDRARALVMTLMMGKAGTDLLRQMASQATGVGSTRSAYWGQVVTSSLPQMVVAPIADQLRKAFLKKFAVGQGANALGRAIPFGIGAAVGGIGNLVLSRTVIQGARTAFGPPPLGFVPDVEIAVKPRVIVIAPGEDAGHRPGPLGRITRLVPRRRSSTGDGDEHAEDTFPSGAADDTVPDIRI
jgi:hypothetical protein